MSKPIVLVEDNASDEKLTLLALRKAGVTSPVHVVRDGSEALDYLSGDDLVAEWPALILLDLNLPRVNGLEVLQRIRADERTKLLPVVILTSSRQDEDIARAYTLGANAYVRKSVDFTEFAEAVKTLAIFWLQLNELPPRKISRGAGV